MNQRLLLFPVWRVAAPHRRLLRNAAVRNCEFAFAVHRTGWTFCPVPDRTVEKPDFIPLLLRRGL